MKVERVDHSEERVQIYFSDYEQAMADCYVNHCLENPHRQDPTALEEMRLNLANSERQEPFELVQMTLPIYKKFRCLIADRVETLRADLGIFSDINSGLDEIEPTPMETLEVSK